MKNHTQFKLFLIITGMLICNHLFAQTDYIVLAKGDTINGKVKYLSYGTDKKVQVISSDKKKQIYSQLQVKAFAIDGETYKNIRTNEGYKFMKIVKSGYLSLYNYQLPNQNTWDGRYLQKNDGKGTDVPNIGFKKVITKLLSDCEDVVKGLETKELTKYKLDVIIDEYNACIEGRSNNNLPPQETTVELINPTTTSALDRWKELENAIKQSPLFDAKENAIEIVNDIKLKILRNEKVSNFLINGLKESLTNQSQLKSALDAALETLPAKQ